jgi:hypothetical protein
MWIEVVKDLGKITEESNHKIDFIFDGNLVLNRTAFGQRDIQASCGCTTPVVNGNVITVNFVAPKIPQHLLYLGVEEWAIRKTINVGYKINDKIERVLLEIVAVIKKN